MNQPITRIRRPGTPAPVVAEAATAVEATVATEIALDDAAAEEDVLAEELPEEDADEDLGGDAPAEVAPVSAPIATPAASPALHRRRMTAAGTSTAQAAAAPAAAPKATGKLFIGSRKAASPKTMEMPDAGKRITQPIVMKMWHAFIQENLGTADFSNATQTETTALFGKFEEFMQNILDKYSFQFAGFLFTHRKKDYCFREPENKIVYVSDHTEVSASKQFGKIKRLCVIANNEFKVGTRDPETKKFVEDTASRAEIQEKFEKHMAASADKAIKDQEALAKRLEKINSRTSA